MDAVKLCRRCQICRFVSKSGGDDVCRDSHCEFSFSLCHYVLEKVAIGGKECLLCSVLNSYAPKSVDTDVNLGVSEQVTGQRRFAALISAGE